MVRERFDDGSQRPDGSTFTLDSPQSWGGSGGTYTNHVRPNGTSYMDFIGNGETEDVDRYRKMGEDAQKRGAYQLDWADSDADHANANQAGALQGDANDILRKQAMGQDNISSDFQRNLLDRGAQQQQGAALSTAGGPLAQIGAAQRVQAGNAAYMQRGNANIRANQANDMATGRSAWAAGLAAQRKNDLQGQQLNDQQAEAQAQSELEQRNLNDQRQLHDEGMAINVEQQALGSRQHQAANDKSIQNANYAKNQADQARQMGYLNTGVAVIGNAAAPGVGSAASAGGTAATAPDPSTDPNNPANRPISDERAKDKKPGALAAMLKDYSGVKLRGLGTPDDSTIELDDADLGSAHSRRVIPGAAADSSSGTSGEARLGGSTGGKVNLADAERARGEAIAARKAAEAAKRPRQAGARKMTPAEIDAFAKKMQADIDAQKTMLNDGPAVGGEKPKPAMLNFKIDSDAGDVGAEQSRADTFGAPKKKPLLLSVDENEGGQSQMLPSDEILHNWRTAHQQPDAKPSDAPAPDAYDRSMFSMNGDGGIGTDALHAGIESKMAHSQKIRDDYTRDNAEDKAGSSRYANRRGTVGDVLGGGPEATYDLGFGAGKSGDRGLAPGTGDAIKYGAMRPDLSKDEASWADYKSDGQTKNFDDFSSAVMTSDERAKDRVETPEQKKAREDKEDAEETAKFMKDSPKDAVVYKAPSGYEERSKAIDEKNAQDKQAAEAQKRETQAPAVAYANDQDARNQQRADMLKRVPLFGAWAQGKVDARRNETDDQKADRAVAWKKDQDATLATRARVDAGARRVSPTAGALSDSMTVGIGYRPDQDSRQRVRQPTSFTRESTSDEGAKNTTSNPLIEMQKDANRRLAGETYTYKDGFGEDPEKMHHGFMAQNLEKNPITALAVVDDGTGVKKVDNVEALRHTAAGVASLQEQHDELEDAVASLMARRSKKRGS